MRRWKINLRTTMGEDSTLGLHWCRSFGKALLLDVDALMEKFALIHPRKMALVNSVQRHLPVNQRCYLRNNVSIPRGSITTIEWNIFSNLFPGLFFFFFFAVELYLSSCIRATLPIFSVDREQPSTSGGRQGPLAGIWIDAWLLLPLSTTWSANWAGYGATYPAHRTLWQGTLHDC